MHDIDSPAQTRHLSRAEIDDLFFETLEAYQEEKKEKESLAEELRRSSDSIKEEKERYKKLRIEYRQLIDETRAESEQASSSDQAHRKLQREYLLLEAFAQGWIEGLHDTESSANTGAKVASATCGMRLTGDSASTVQGSSSTDSGPVIVERQQEMVSGSKPSTDDNIRRSETIHCSGAHGDGIPSFCDSFVSYEISRAKAPNDSERGADSRKRTPAQPKKAKDGTKSND
ncbi:MAG: hypothetical protein Q9213_001172 [Squamulea squamosa]